VGARDTPAPHDWISLWWAQDGWFWSKPILNFWMQSLAMASLGTHYKADDMLMGVGGPTAHPEWVVRAPNVLFTILAMYILYKGVARIFGRRAGLLGALVLATMPDWFFLAHQTMTDMPFVASMTAAMGLLLIGLHVDEEQKARVYEVVVPQRAALIVFAILTAGSWLALLACGVIVYSVIKKGPSLSQLFDKNAKLTFRLSAWHLVFGAILLCAIPQILYLLSRNLELVLHGDGPYGFRPHWDEFRSGSAGNCGMPGNEACNLTASAAIPKSVGAHPIGFTNELVRTFGAFEPFIQATLWAVVLGSVLYMNWGERRLRRLLYIAAWFFAALATMAKGPAGFALPMICAFAYVCTKKKWSELARFEILSGVLIILCVALPWYVAMYVRHGSPFTDRLIFHDMFNRAFHHVHDTNEGDDTGFRFYIWQLGYALFPWTGLAALGLIWWLRKSDEADAGRGDASVFLAWWFLFGFALFSFMGTKFHHYIFPAVPPAAMLTGVVLDEMIGRRRLAKRGSLPLYLAGVTGGIAVAVAGITRFWPGTINGEHPPPGPGGNALVSKETLAEALRTANFWTGAFIAGVGITIIVLVIRRYRCTDQEQKDAAPPAETELDPAQAPYRAGVKEAAPDPMAHERSVHESVMIGAAAVAGALTLALVARDLAIKPDGADQPGAIRLLHLFTYNYRRPWPDTLDFSAILTAFGVAAVVLSLVLAVRKIRPHAAALFLAFGFVWAIWGLDVYMIKTSPHWGQHEVIQAYYANRAGKNEPLVAYQMNWKGENFYTGNHVPAFVSSGANFTNWLKQQREAGIKVMYFITEHSRTNGLRSEVGAKAYREITDKALCNKFVLVRAEL
jgi:4-amino-4-deoxy-L-arabinose transferase-like glycosyltransferase